MYTVSAGSDVGAEVAAAEALVVEERHCASGMYLGLEVWVGKCSILLGDSCIDLDCFRDIE